MLEELSLIIPAYNEEKTVCQVVEQAKSFFSLHVKNGEIILIDDGSEDSTGQLAESSGIKVLRNPVNLGYGNSLKKGLRAARYSHVAICDADGTYDPQDFAKLIPYAEELDMVIGARTGKEFLGKGIKRIARWFQLQLVRFTIGIKIPDANSGMRIFKKDVIKRLAEGLCGGFSFTTSISLAMHSTGCSVKYVPIDYHPRLAKSNVRFVRDTLRSMQLLLQAILKYNPLKAFITLMLIPLLALLASTVLAILAWYMGAEFFGLMVLISALNLICSVIVFGLGMLAYAIRNGQNE